MGGGSPSCQSTPLLVIAALSLAEFIQFVEFDFPFPDNHRKAEVTQDGLTFIVDGAGFTAPFALHGFLLFLSVDTGHVH